MLPLLDAFIMVGMFASNNKPSRRSVRGTKKAASASSRSRGRTSTTEDASSFSRSSYASKSNRAHQGTSAYSAAKYGSSTRKGAGSSYRSASGGGYVPATPAAANSQYSRKADSLGEAALQRSRQNKARRKRIALMSVLVVVVLLVGGVGAAWAYISQVDSALKENLDEDLLNSLTATDTASDPFYMLLIGVDKSQAREESGSVGGIYRTDSMMLARIDPQDKKVTLISVPRDTRVMLEGHGYQKINAAYAFGGASGAIDAVSELAGVPINHYAEIDFDGFEAVVDALGGIEVNVPMEIDDSKAGGHVDAGEQTLNGKEALILCRSRHAYDEYGDGDSYRAANQRLVLSAIMDKVMSSDVATLTSTVSTLAEYVTTDYSVTGILGLAQNMMGIDVSENVYTASVPTESAYEDGVWWEVLQENEWDTMMERVDQGLSPTEEAKVDKATGVTMSSAGDGGSSNKSADSSKKSSAKSSNSLSEASIAVRNGSGISGVAGQAAQLLTAEGASVDTGNADSSDYSKTLVIYDDDSQKDTAQTIADILGVGEVKKNDGTYRMTKDYLVVVGSDWEA